MTRFDADWWRREFETVCDLLDAQETAIRAIHRPVSNGAGICYGCADPYPCPTIQALR